VNQEHQTKRFWLIELWFENREIFKEFVRHALFVLLLLASLEGLNRLFRLSSLPSHELNLFGKLHFYMSIMILLLFILSFIIKLLKSEFREGQEMTRSAGIRSFMREVFDMYDSWNSELLINFTVLVLSTSLALVLDLRFGMPPATVLSYVLPLTVVLMVAVPAAYVAIIRASRRHVDDVPR
jgi:hypothetical protein